MMHTSTHTHSTRTHTVSLYMPNAHTNAHTPTCTTHTHTHHARYQFTLTCEGAWSKGGAMVCAKECSCACLCVRVVCQTGFRFNMCFHGYRTSTASSMTLPWSSWIPSIPTPTSSERRRQTWRRLPVDANVERSRANVHHMDWICACVKLELTCACDLRTRGF